MSSYSFRSERAVQALDVTEAVSGLAGGPGLYLASCPHTTAALMLSESDDELLEDFEDTVARIAKTLGTLRHHKNDNPNGAAHIMSGMFGSQLLLPVGPEGLEVGQYQRLVFLEMDGPRDRTIRLAHLGLLKHGGD